MEAGLALFRRPKPSTDIPVVGAVRFSVLMQEAAEFRLSRGASFEERRAILFDPERLELRFRIFEAVTLPSALAQPSEAFSLLVASSTELPEPFRTRLNDLLAPHPNVHLIEVAPDQPLPAQTRQALDRMHPDAARMAVLRLDDDDGLASYFTEDLIRAIKQWDRGQDMAFSFPLGHLLGLPEDPGQLLLHKMHHNYAIACGLTLLTTKGHRRSIFELGWPHRMIDRALPTLSESKRPAYILVSHATNDTGTESIRWNRLRKCKLIPPAEARKALGREFGHLDLDALAS